MKLCKYFRQVHGQKQTFLKACAFCYTQQQQQLQITNTNTNYKYVLDLLITKQNYRVNTKIKSNQMHSITKRTHTICTSPLLSVSPTPLPFLLYYVHQGKLINQLAKLYAEQHTKQSRTINVRETN